MRGKISDQDLTNYALNDGLDARERLYVESMLGVSEECRNDVYRLLEVAQLLETGFEAKDDGAQPSLTCAQRERLLNPPPEHGALVFLRKSAASLALAACVAFVLVNSRFLQMDRNTRRVAAVSAEVSRMVSEAMASGESDNIALWVTPPTMMTSEDDDSTAFIRTSGEVLPSATETICTPPTAQQAMEYSLAQ